MKVRNGYVSNSSSSSFLICYKGVRDFSKFKEFNGYEIFKSDLKRANAESGKSHLRAIVANQFHNEFYKLYDFDKGFGRSFFGFYDLFEIAGVEMDEYNAVAGKIADMFQHGVFDKIEEKYPGSLELLCSSQGDIYVQYVFLKEEGMKFLQSLRTEVYNKFWGEEFAKLLKKSAKSIADKLYKGLRKHGFIVKSLCYDDHSDDGSMMENGFMPFLGTNPERKYEIFTTNEH